MAHETDRPLRCSTHSVDAEIHASEIADSQVTCPVCGRADTLAFAQAEAAKADLGGAIERAIERSSASDVVPPPPDSPDPRWVFGAA